MPSAGLSWCCWSVSPRPGFDWSAAFEKSNSPHTSARMNVSRRISTRTPMRRKQLGCGCFAGVTSFWAVSPPHSSRVTSSVAVTFAAGAAGAHARASHQKPSPSAGGAGVGGGGAVSVRGGVPAWALAEPNGVPSLALVKPASCRIDSAACSRRWLRSRLYWS